VFAQFGGALLAICLFRWLQPPTEREASEVADGIERGGAAA